MHLRRLPAAGTNHLSRLHVQRKLCSRLTKANSHRKSAKAAGSSASPKKASPSLVTHFNSETAAKYFYRVPNNADVVILESEPTEEMLRESVRTLPMRTRTISRDTYVAEVGVETGSKRKMEVEATQPEKVYTSDSSECAICMCEDKEVIIVPCGHFCFCKGCVDTLKRTSGQCAMCRVHIQTYILPSQMR
jgi:Zinc finger, C3HC4 type (RING finger)